MNPRKRRTLFRCLAVVATVVLTFGLLELVGAIGLHLIGEKASPPLPPELQDRVVMSGRSPDMRSDPYLLYRVEPEQKAEHFNTNALGLRGGPLQKGSPDEIYRVVLLGGSVAWGYSSWDDADTITAYLQAYLGKHAEEPGLAGKRIEVLNAGVPSYVCWQEALSYSIYLRGLQPDAVILLDGANEIASAIRQKGAGLPLRFDPTRRPFARLKPSLGASLGVWLRYRLRRLKIRRLLYAGEVSPLEAYSPPPPATIGLAYREALRLAGDVAHADGALLLPVLQPAAFIPESKPLTAYEEAIVRHHEETMPGRNAYYVECYGVLRQALSEFGAEREDVDPLDASLVFAGRSEGCYTDHCHLTPRGRQLLAEEIGGALLERLRR